MSGLRHGTISESGGMREGFCRAAIIIAASLAPWLSPGAAWGQDASATSVVAAGAKTRGGLVAAMRIVHVTSLADDGEGSLRAALDEPGPSVIVFDVAGVIDLASDLQIASPHVTVAGQTAPAPGIFLRGAKLRIAAQHVVVQHLSVSPVASASLEVNGSIDAISIGRCANCEHQVSDVRLENISAGWSTDEIIGLWGDGVSHITIRNSLLAEALDQAGHPKGQHSMGLLIGSNVEAVEVVGNLFASNRWRNPVVGAGASAYIANNFIHNPGKAALHLYGDRSDRVTRASFVGNVVKRGPSTESRSMTAVQLPTAFKEPSSGAVVFATDNHCCTGSANGRGGTSGGASILVGSPPVTSRSWTPFSAKRVWSWVSRHAGSRPSERSAFDRRIVGYVAEGGGKIIDSAAEVGGYPIVVDRNEPAHLPPDPSAPAPPGVRAETRLEAWLCLRHLEVGGPQTPECPDDEATLRAAIIAAVQGAKIQH